MGLLSMEGWAEVARAIRAHALTLVMWLAESLCSCPVGLWAPSVSVNLLAHNVLMFPGTSTSESDSGIETSSSHSGSGPYTKYFHVYRQCLTWPFGHRLLQLCGDTEQCTRRLARVSKTHFQNVKWPSVTSLLSNCCVPGLLSGDTLQPTFSEWDHLSTESENFLPSKQQQSV